MTHQRRRQGKPVILYPTKVTTDLDGAETVTPDFDNPIEPGNGYTIYERGQQAEAPGQVQVNVVNLMIPYVAGVNSWWRIRYDGKDWDVTGPPVEHKLAPRHGKHISILIQERGGTNAR